MGEPRRALIVDDNPGFAAIAGASLRDAGWEVAFASTADRAVVLLSGWAPTRVFVDLRMATALVSQATASGALVVGLCGLLTDDDRLRAASLGLHGVLSRAAALDALPGALLAV